MTRIAIATCQIRRWRWMFGLLGCAACAQTGRDQGAANRAVAQQSSRAATTPAQSGGMVLYKDPVTGEFTDPPPAAGLGRRSAADTAAPSLVEASSPVSGRMIDLNGRFQTQLKIKRGTGGAVDVRCTEHDAEARHD